MLFDTDILIWIQRGNQESAKLVDNAVERYLSIQSYMELLQCARNKGDHRSIKEFLKAFDFNILQFSQNIGHRAAIYVEEYSLSHGVRAGDALIAATAVENNLILCSSNQKHFKCINELRLLSFRP